MPHWKKETRLQSKGRKLLEGDITEGRVTDDIHWHFVFQQRPEFDVRDTYEDALRLFPGRLKAA